MEFQHVIDQNPTFNKPLSAKYSKCFAYLVFKERIPSILQNVINYLEDTEHIRKYCEQALLEVDNVITNLKNFQSSIKSDKPMKPVQMTGDLQDEQNWYNKELERRQAENEGNAPSWFQTDWLFAECYFYFKLLDIFHESKAFVKFDPFYQSKVDAIAACSNNEAAFLAGFWYDIKQKGSLDESEKKKYFSFFLKCALWGNQADLSLSLGEVTTMKENMLQEIDSMDHQILSNDTDKTYDILNRGKNNVIDVVLDNVGFELHNDLIFADYLVTFGLADEVIFHAKKIPWFISDVTPKDFEMQFLMFETTRKTLEIKRSWTDYLREGTWSVKAEAFWVLPFDYGKMARVDPELYAELSKSTLVIFKGDLNYRKLVGDIYWVPTTSFRSALRGFEPTNVLALRTIKADSISGLAEGVFEELNKTEPDWMHTGKYALIQMS